MVKNRLIYVLGLLMLGIAIWVLSGIRIRPLFSEPTEHKANARAAQNLRGGTDVSPAKTEDIQLPMVGTVRCNKIEDKISLLTSDGETDLAFTVYLRDNGRFLRAEFIAPGSVDYATPLPRLERAMKSWDEAIIGFVDETPSVGWKEIVAKLPTHGNMQGVKRISITLVNYRVLNNAPHPPT
jgi:hypothetical protein